MVQVEIDNTNIKVMWKVVPYEIVYFCFVGCLANSRFLPSIGVG